MRRWCWSGAGGVVAECNASLKKQKGKAIFRRSKPHVNDGMVHNRTTINITGPCAIVKFAVVFNASLAGSIESEKNFQLANNRTNKSASRRCGIAALMSKK